MCAGWILGECIVCAGCKLGVSVVWVQGVFWVCAVCKGQLLATNSRQRQNPINKALYFNKVSAKGRNELNG